MENPIYEIAIGYHQYGKDKGRAPRKVYCHSDVLRQIHLQIGDEPDRLSFQFSALTVEVDNSLAPDELKFAD